MWNHKKHNNEAPLDLTKPPRYATHNWPSSRASSLHGNQYVREIANAPRLQQEYPQYLPPSLSNQNNYNRSDLLRHNREDQTLLTKEQCDKLEDEFISHNYISGEKRTQLGTELNLLEGTIRTWFQIRRFRKKREQSELSTSTPHAANLPPYYHPSSLKYVPRYGYYPYLNYPYIPSMHLPSSTAAMAGMRQALLLHNNILRGQAQMFTRLETSSQRNREQSGSHGFKVE